MTPDQLRELLLAQTKREYDVVPCPEIGPGVAFRLQSLDEYERSEYEVAQMGNKFGTDREDRLLEARRELLIRCLVDDDGNTYMRATDLDALGRVRAKLTAKLYNRALKLCGLRNSDVEELVGNSEGTRAGASPCASPSPAESGTST